MKTPLLVIVLITCCGQLVAQEKDTTKHKISYASFVRMAMTVCNNCQYEGSIPIAYASTVHGAQLTDRLTVGGGLGFTSARDAYIVPVFTNVKFDLFGKKSKVYLDVDFGAGKAWPARGSQYYNYYNVRCSRYFQPSIGYAWKRQHTWFSAFAGVQSIALISESSFAGPGYMMPYDFVYSQPIATASKVKYAVLRGVVGIVVRWH